MEVVSGRDEGSVLPLLENEQAKVANRTLERCSGRRISRKEELGEAGVLGGTLTRGPGTNYGLSSTITSPAPFESKAERGRCGPSTGGEWRNEASKTGPCASTVREAEDLTSQTEAAKADPVVGVGSPGEMKAAGRWGSQGRPQCWRCARSIQDRHQHEHFKEPGVAGRGKLGAKSRAEAAKAGSCDGTLREQ